MSPACVFQGQRHGQGTCRYANGDSYEGAWRHGLFHGQGQLRSAEGVYDGPWKDGLKHGKEGRFTWTASADVYLGDWQHGLRTGNGTLTGGGKGGGGGGSSEGGEQGDEYKGQWLANLRHGKGVQTSLDLEAGLGVGGDEVSVYDGNWAHGKREGQGTFHYWKGFYCGEWANDERSGYGEFRYPDGEMHKGGYLHGRKHGPGFYRFATNQVFEGQFAQGRFQGLGAKWDAHAKLTQCGRWHQGDFTGQSQPVPIHLLPVGQFLSEQGLCGDGSHGRRENAAPADLSALQVIRSPFPLSRVCVMLAGKSASLLLVDGSTYTGPFNSLYQRHGRGVVHSATGAQLESGEWVADVLQAPSVSRSSESGSYADIGVALLSSMLLTPISTGVSGLSAIAAFAGSSLSYATAAATPSLDDSAAAAIAAAAATEPSTTTSFDSPAPALHSSSTYSSAAAASSPSASAVAANANYMHHDRQIDL